MPFFVRKIRQANLPWDRLPEVLATLGLQEIDKFDEKIELTAIASEKTPYFT
jgi:hypothetical protein